MPTTPQTTTHHRIASFALAALAGALTLLLVACREQSPAPAPAPSGTGNRPTIVATTGMIADLARSIAGDRAQVTALMGEGVDPHLYKPSPGDVRMLSEADGVLYNGLHLEGRMGEVLENLGKRKVVVAVAERLDHAKLISPPEFPGEHDPHVWFDVSLWAEVAPAIRDALIKADPAGEADYRRGSEQVQSSLAALHTEVKTALAAVPPERRVLVTAHDAFGYFGRAYGFEVLAVQGISTDSEAGLKDINQLVDVLVSRKIPAVFFESSVPRRAIDALIEGAGSRGHTVRLGGELFSDAMGASGTPEGTYAGMIRHNVKVIVDALGHAEPAAAPRVTNP